MSFYVSTTTFILLHCDEWDRVVALPRHKFVTGDTLLQLTIGLRFSLYQKLSKLRQKKFLRRFFANFCHEIGCENDQTYIFRFVRYLSTFFYTYLPINIHFQFIIITNISFVTNPAYFVRHLASPVDSF